MIEKSIEATIHLITLGFVVVTGFVYLCYRFYKKKIKKKIKKN